MKLITVTDRKTEKIFLDVAREIYKNDPHWVCPLDSEIKNIFNPRENNLFKEGDAIRWILIGDSGKAEGRIAAFYNTSRTSAVDLPAGGAGFFECINDQNSANALFNAAAEWLKNKGLKAMDAPVNFGENDSNWGLLVDGFMQQGIGMPYHFPYYRDLFENYGFRLFFKQFSYHLDLTQKFPERFWRIAERIVNKPDFSFSHFSWEQSEKYISDLVTIYNNTWSKFKEDYTPLDPAPLRKMLNKLKLFLDEEIIWFAYYKNEPISFFIMLPDINQVLKKMNGKMNFGNFLRLLYYRKTKKITRLRATVAGVVPRFQNTGVESGIFWHMNKIMVNKPHIKEIELSWVGDYNPKMIALYRATGAVQAKTHHTYRYMIDPAIPFERFMPECVAAES